MSEQSKDGWQDIAKERADWLLDAVAVATQNRMFLRGDDAYDAIAGDAILMNGEKAILIAITRSTPPAKGE
jgi:hypothetical protein